MRNNLSAIKLRIPNTEKVAEIPLMNRNLIITGINGCGKTRFIDALHGYLQECVISRASRTAVEVQDNLNHLRNILSQTTRADSNYDHYKRAVKETERRLEQALNPPATFSDLKKLIIDVADKKAVLLKFEATRQAKIRESTGAKSTLALEVEAEQSSAALLFEDYLVCQKTLQAYAESPRMANNSVAADSIAAWFDKLQLDLRELFEDDSLVLHFDYHEQSMYIRQDGKADYRFQQLSSGFSSILAIYAELLTKIQLSAANADEVYGVVIIDEIDAHLHVSLQRKILAFLVKSFPCIQFIVTTHSPFVVSSVSDAVIYDLSTLECIDDLSMYSYESILSGLFQTALVSEVLEEKIVKLGKSLESPDPDIDEIETFVREIGEHEKVLDSESAFFLKKARMVVNKKRSEDRNV